MLQILSPYVRVSGLTTQTPDLGRTLSSEACRVSGLTTQTPGIGPSDYLLNILVSRFKF